MAPLPFRLRCKIALALAMTAICAPFSERAIRRQSEYLSAYIRMLDIVSIVREAHVKATYLANDEALEQLTDIGEIQSTDESPKRWMHVGPRSIN
jgi:hypothetical protein